MKTVIPTLVSNNSSGVNGNGANYVARSKTDPEPSTSYFACSTSSTSSTSYTSGRNDQIGGEVRFPYFSADSDLE